MYIWYVYPPPFFVMWQISNRCCGGVFMSVRYMIPFQAWSRCNVTWTFSKDVPPPPSERGSIPGNGGKRKGLLHFPLMRFVFIAALSCLCEDNRKHLKCKFLCWINMWQTPEGRRLQVFIHERSGSHSERLNKLTWGKRETRVLTHTSWMQREP